MIDKINKKMECFINDPSLLNEAKFVVNKASALSKFEVYLKFIENSKNLDELYFRIDDLKDNLVKENLVDKNPLDKFGNAAYLEFEDL